MASLVLRGSNWYIYDRIKKDGAFENITPICLGAIDKNQATIELSKYRIGKGDGKKHGDNDMPMIAVYNAYLEVLRDSTDPYSPHTINDVMREIPPFIAMISTVGDLTEEKMRAYDKRLRMYRWKRTANGLERKLAIDTIAHRLRTISAFIGWMKDANYIRERPYSFDIPKGRKDAGRDLGEVVMKQFVSGLSGEVQIVSCLLFWCGFRIGEILPRRGLGTSLQHEWINRRDSLIRLPDTKNDEPREVPIPISIMETIPKGKSGPVFSITQWAVRSAWRRRIKAMGLQGRLRLHDARVTSASEYARKFKDVRGLMDLYGWKTAAMAMHYVKKSKLELRQEVQSMYSQTDGSTVK